MSLGIQREEGEGSRRSMSRPHKFSGLYEGTREPRIRRPLRLARGVCHRMTLLLLLHFISPRTLGNLSQAISSPPVYGRWQMSCNTVGTTVYAPTSSSAAW